MNNDQHDDPTDDATTSATDGPPTRFTAGVADDEVLAAMLQPLAARDVLQSLQILGPAVRQMLRQPEASEACALEMVQRMQRAGAFDEVLMQAAQEAVTEWLCRGQDDLFARVVAHTALGMLGDAYWRHLSLELLDAFFSYGVLS
jgi:hypothetical protein